MKVQAGLDLAWGEGPVASLVQRRMPRHGLSGPVDPGALWSAAFFGLDRVGLFSRAPEAVQRQVVADCGRAALLEAYFIEKAGIAYAAKMVLLAESADERTLYALFGAEEARHLDAVRAALGPVDEAGWAADPFLCLLQQVVEEADRPTGQLVIQVVLEGWGLSHYAALRDACAHPGLADLLGAIVADEAGHHGAGVALLRDARLPRPAHAVELLDAMLGMVAAGPVGVAGALERRLGGLSAAARRQVFAELDAGGHVRTRLGRLRGCLDKVPGAREVTDALAARGRFDVPEAFLHEAALPATALEVS